MNLAKNFIAQLAFFGAFSKGIQNSNPHTPNYYCIKKKGKKKNPMNL